MRTALLASLVLLAACPEPEETEDEVDIDALLAVADDWADQDIAALESETYELELDGTVCDVPRWLYVPVYAWNPDTGKGEGIHLENRQYDISALDEQTPRIVNYHIEEDGSYTQVGLEWYFEPPAQEEVNPRPEIFGVELDGIMDPHTPFQFLHYDQHAWIWNYTSEENEAGYFGNFNQGMEPPSWWFDYEPTLFDSFRFNGPPNVYMEQGYDQLDGTCEDGVGWRATNAAIPTDAADPFAPTSLIVDQNLGWIGSEWLVEDTGQDRPTMHGQDFFGPNADGFYYFRTWAAGLMNPDGLFNETHSIVDCNAPPAPMECLGAPI